MEKAAIYVRVSTDAEAQRDSPLHQVQTCKEYSDWMGFDTSENLIYNDAGLSGTELERRVEVQRLLRDARQGKFDVVLFTAISRFSRDLSDAFNMKKKLESVYGIRLISIEEGYDTAVEGRNNDMVFTVHAMLAAHKSREMSLAIRRGRRQAAKRGRHTGNQTPYGYVKTKDKKLVPDPATAQIVRKIYEWYQSGRSTRNIAEALNQGGIPTAHQINGKSLSRWQSSTVHAILTNPAYIGRIVANRWTKARDLEQSRQHDRTIKKFSLRPMEEWVVVKSAHPQIISPELFEMVQEKLKQKTSSKKRSTGVNPLTGRILCGECGRAMIVTGSGKRNRHGEVQRYRYLVCSQVKRQGKDACRNHQHIPYGVFMESIVGVIRTMWERMLQELGAGVKAPVVNVHGGAVKDGKLRELESVHQQLENNRQRQRENLLALQEGLFSHDVIVEAQHELLREAQVLEERRRELTTFLDADNAQLSFMEHEVMWNVELAPPHPLLSYLLRTLIEQIRVFPEGRIQVFLSIENPEVLPP